MNLFHNNIESKIIIDTIKKIFDIFAYDNSAKFLYINDKISRPKSNYIIFNKENINFLIVTTNIIREEIIILLIIINIWKIFIVNVSNLILDYEKMN